MFESTGKINSKGKRKTKIVTKSTGKQRGYQLSVINVARSLHSKDRGGRSQINTLLTS